MINTTLNVDVNTYSRLQESAKKNDLKLKEIIHFLLKMIASEKPLAVQYFKRLKYQDRISGRQWKVIHLQLSENDYETCIDLRIMHKISLAGLLELAVELFLETAVESLRSSNDRYFDNSIILEKHAGLLIN